MTDPSEQEKGEDKELTVYGEENSVLHLYNFLNKKVLATHSAFLFQFDHWHCVNAQANISEARPPCIKTFQSALRQIMCQKPKCQGTHIKSILCSCVFDQ